MNRLLFASSAAARARSLPPVPPSHPVKVTSGAGFAFEDKVGAYLCAALLAGEHLLGTDVGPIRRIDFQVGADGWALDDVLVTFGSGAETTRWCVSIKDTAYIRARAPRPFVEQVWSELCGTSGSGFAIGSDLVGLICAPLPGSTSSDLQELMRLARSQDPDDLARRIEVPGFVSDARRTLWASFAPPATIPVPPMLSRSPGEALRHLRAKELDFEHAPSTAEAHALRLCGDALVDRSQARELWDALVVLVARERTAGGYADRAKLLAALGGQHRLRPADDIEPSSPWRRVGPRALAVCGVAVALLLVALVVWRAGATSDEDQATPSTTTTTTTTKPTTTAPPTTEAVPALSEECRSGLPIVVPGLSPEPAELDAPGIMLPDGEISFEVVLGQEDLRLRAEEWNRIVASSQVPRWIGVELDPGLDPTKTTRARFQYLADRICQYEIEDPFLPIGIGQDQRNDADGLLSLTALVNTSASYTRVDRLSVELTTQDPAARLGRTTFYDGPGEEVLIPPTTILFTLLRFEASEQDLGPSRTFDTSFEYDIYHCGPDPC